MTAAYVYRAYTRKGRLLYVGHTIAPGGRMTHHRGTSQWWPFAHRVTFEAFASLDAAKYAEKIAIRVEWPIFNTQHRAKDHPDGGPFYLCVAPQREAVLALARAS